MEIWPLPSWRDLGDVGVLCTFSYAAGIARSLHLNISLPVPEFIDPVFTKTSSKRSFSLNRKRAFWLVFAKTLSIISGTGQAIQYDIAGSTAHPVQIIAPEPLCVQSWTVRWKQETLSLTTYSIVCSKVYTTHSTGTE